MARRPVDSKPGAKAAHGDDRRDSPRVPMTFLLREKDNEEWVERSGDLSLGGIFWHGRTPSTGTEVDVRFRLTGVPREVRAKGEIIRVKEQGSENIDFHLRFTELDVESELAVAKYLDDWLETSR